MAGAHPERIDPGAWPRSPGIFWSLLAPVLLGEARGPRKLECCCHGLALSSKDHLLLLL